MDADLLSVWGSLRLKKFVNSSLGIFLPLSMEDFSSCHSARDENSCGSLTWKALSVSGIYFLKFSLCSELSYGFLFVCLSLWFYSFIQFILIVRNIFFFNFVLAIHMFNILLLKH